MNKDYIISEIQRTASENNGSPLGKQRFAKESGIKESDWYGKYWTKWSDAIIEAGYIPNKMQSAYDEDVLIEMFINHMKKIGHFPSKGEVMLEARTNDTFPGHNTFANRLGNKQETANKIITYCQNKPEFFEIVNICRDVLATTNANVEIEISNDIDTNYGYVYLMKFGKFYKIGYSSNVERRNYEIGVKLPEELKIIHKIRTDDPAGIEAYWHRRFEDKRKNGEWFELTPSDITAFRRRKFM